MSLLERIRKNQRNPSALSKFSLDAIRISIEVCGCPKDRLCDACKDLLEYYKWRKAEREKYLDDACKWLIHQMLLAFYGPKYKEHDLHFNKDIYTLKEMVELHDEYLKEKNERRN